MKRNYQIAVISKGAFARTIRIYAPDKCDRAVIFADGGAWFDGDDNIVALAKRLKIKNTALVAIDSNESTRLADFLPFPVEKSDFEFPEGGGGAESYRDYIVTTLVPYLIKRFSINRFAFLGKELGCGAALTLAACEKRLFEAFCFICPPLFVSPAAFDGFLKSAKFHDAKYYIHTAAPIGESFLRPVPRILFSACGMSVAAALTASGVSSIILDTNEKDADGKPAAPVSKFLKMFASLAK